MQIVAVPLYNREMGVDSYVFRYHRGSTFSRQSQTVNLFDGGSRSLALETLDLTGLDAFTLGKPIFVPISYINLLGNLHKQTKIDPSKIIFLFEDNLRQEALYISKIDELIALGFRFAVSNIESPERYAPILRRCSFIFLSQRPENLDHSNKVMEYIGKFYRDAIKPVAIHIRSDEQMKELGRSAYALYETRFFSVPITKGDTNVSPLKANSIRLLNTIQDENFEFDEVTSIVQGDPALTISLLKMVNARTIGRNKIKTISHAVATLGQSEVRKWVTTAVSQSLGNDQPNEITRISLVRAKFAENLAPLYEMAHMAQGLFLMGLFSVLDVILGVPMADALKVVQVSDVIRNALVDSSGPFYPVLNMLVDYECAYWSSVSRQLIMNDIADDALSDAYLDALGWYRNLTMVEAEEEKTEAVLVAEAETQA
jgi:EAL and modified HD-GYP domain-containing signal transduction protein